MLATASSVLEMIVDSYTSKMRRYVNGVLQVVIALGFGGFQANIIQFGIDQLHDASTKEITLFILWYVWTYPSCGLVVYFIFGCLPNQYLIVVKLVMCIYSSVALSSMLVFNHWLVKEPVTQNSFKLVYSVIRYAIKHKHPECRSAFTFCEDEPPSCIDFSKSKYGGLFTTEQVEDVKTFLQFIIFILIAVVTFCAMYASWRLRDNVLKMLINTNNAGDASVSKCYYNEAFVETFVHSSFVILPFYELVLYPVCHQCWEIKNLVETSFWTFF